MHHVGLDHILFFVAVSRLLPTAGAMGRRRQTAVAIVARAKITAAPTRQRISIANRFMGPPCIGNGGAGHDNDRNLSDSSRD